MKIMRLSILVILLLALVSCGKKKTPSRDHIPEIKERVYLLQEAIKDQNRAAIDSLLSTDILDAGQNSDSLISFCFGSDGSFGFERLGNCVIAYTNKNAEARGFVMDSTEAEERPVRLMWVYQHDMWLLSHFEMGDSTTNSF